MDTQPNIEDISSMLAPGQVWHYRTRAGEESSTVIINRIESAPNYDQIFHITIQGLNIPTPETGESITQIDHAPVSLPTLLTSLTDLVETTDPCPAGEQWYQTWKAEFDQNKAGVFLISIADIVSVIERSFYRLQ
jgi:hypothetical protein